MEDTTKTEVSKNTVSLESLVPDSFPEQYILDEARLVNSLSPEDIQKLTVLSQEVAQFANKFDFIIVSGRSRVLTKTLLEKGGVLPGKIKEFNHYLNSIAYKNEEAPYASLNDEQRVAIIKDALEKMLPPGQEKKPSVCVVDDRMRSGQKAQEYLQIFSKIDDIGDYAFAAFVSQFPQETQDKLFLPAKPAPGVYRIINALSALTAATSTEYIHPDEALKADWQAPILKVTQDALVKIKA